MDDTAQRGLPLALTVLLASVCFLAGCPGKMDPTWQPRREEAVLRSTEHPDIAAARREWERSRTPAARVALGNAYLEHGEPVKAYRQFEAALAADPDNVGALLGLGRLHTDLGNYDAAVDAYNRALAIEGDNEMAHNSLGLVYLQRGQLDEAAQQFRQVIELNRHNVAPRLCLGVTYLRAQRIDDAIRTYREAIEVAPDSSWLHVNYGHALEIKGDLGAAEKQYRRALYLDPEDGAAKNNLAFVLALQNTNLAEALDLADEAIAAQPEVASFHDTRGWVLFKMGRKRQAVSALQSAISLSPGNLAAQYHLGVAYDEMGEPDLAMPHLRRAQRDFRFSADAARRIRRIESRRAPRA